MTGDSAWADADGYCWVTGRIDDMLNVSGHLLSTAEIESALNEHKFIAESAVVPRSHPVKGVCLFTFACAFCVVQILVAHLRVARYASSTSYDRVFLLATRT